MRKLPFMTESGDTYLIDEDKYEKETNEYIKAVNNGDEETIMKFETAQTGWEYFSE